MGLRVGIRRVDIRYDRDSDLWLLRCESCSTSGAGTCWWPLSEEFWNPNQGMQRCRACHRAERRRLDHARNLANPEFMRARRRRYYHNSRERILAARRRRYAENRDAIRAARNAKYAARKAA